MKNSISILSSVVAVTLVLALGAFANVAHAQVNDGWYGGDTSGVSDGWYSGSTGGVSDGWYSPSSSSANDGWYSGTSPSVNDGWYNPSGSSVNDGWYGAGIEYAANAPGTEYAANAPGTEYAVNAPCDHACGTEYAANAPGTEYAANAPTTYDANCNCYTTPSSLYGSTYGTSAIYGSASYIPSIAYMPLVAQPYFQPYAAYLPTLAASSPYFLPTSAPTIVAQPQRAPTITTSAPSISTPSSQTQTSTNTNTNTNTPIAIATTTNGPITVNVAPVSQVPQYPAQYPVQYTFPTPACTITSSNSYNNGYSYNYNNYNQPMTLTWSSSNATSAYISPGVGSVSPTGSMTVYPNGYTTYTMTVYGAGGTGTCQTTANYTYAAPTYVAPTYIAPAAVAPVAPYVSLSQIPYTGFDYGPVGNAIYWLSLLSFAVAAAYLIVYYRGGAFAFATSLTRGRSNTNDLSEGTDTRENESAVVASIIAPETPQREEHAFKLPAMENHLPAQAGRLTTDSMIMERSTTGAPRIVIARG